MSDTHQGLYPTPQGMNAINAPVLSLICTILVAWMSIFVIHIFCPLSCFLSVCPAVSSMRLSCLSSFFLPVHSWCGKAQGSHLFVCLGSLQSRFCQLTWDGYFVPSNSSGFWNTPTLCASTTSNSIIPEDISVVFLFVRFAPVCLKSRRSSLLCSPSYNLSQAKWAGGKPSFSIFFFFL